MYINNWNNICWKTLEIQLFREQNKIYQTRVLNNKANIYYIQTKLIWSNFIKLIAIHKIKYHIENKIIITNYKKYILQFKFFSIMFYNILIAMIIYSSYKEIIKYTYRQYFNFNINNSRIKDVHFFIDKYNYNCIIFAMGPEWKRNFSWNYLFNSCINRIDNMYNLIFSHYQTKQFQIRILNPIYFKKIKFYKLFNYLNDTYRYYMNELIIIPFIDKKIQAFIKIQMNNKIFTHYSRKVFQKKIFCFITNNIRIYTLKKNE